jgi:hypothetical protein
LAPNLGVHGLGLEKLILRWKTGVTPEKRWRHGSMRSLHLGTWINGSRKMKWRNLEAQKEVSEEWMQSLRAKL